MSVERILILDPYNEEHRKMINSYEEENNPDIKISENIENLRSTLTKENYKEKTKKQNEISEYLFIEKNMKITDICVIQGEKDIKTCKISFPNSNLNTVKNKLASLSANYVIDSFGMEEVFITVSKDNKSMIKHLDSEGFENLGEYNGKIMYLKEKNDQEQMQRKIS